ncbi:MAG: hypothetical protein J6O71_04625 [Lachnospiraceae bacterium]|nr:hypothetical protein [Lachnospiraceae bacterium]
MSSVYKRQFIETQEDKLVINSNKKIAERLEELSKIVGGDGTVSADGFSEGLSAVNVSGLVEGAEEYDEEGNPISNVIKADAAPPPPPEPEPEPVPQIDVEAILAEANEQAQAIIADAQAQAEQIRAQAAEDGRNEGLSAGHDEGYQAGMAEVEGMKQQLLQEEAELQADFERRVDELEPIFIETLTGIYEHIFHVNFAEQKEVIFYLIQDALKNIEGGRNMIIHVSANDYGFVSMQKKELLEGISGSDSAEIVEDVTLKPNECYIETDSGIFDCSLETQLAGLKRELRLLSYSGHEGGEEA